MSKPTKPNPGSEEAQGEGCICPVIDNHYGQGVPDGEGGFNFWINNGCRVHNTKDESDD